MNIFFLTRIHEKIKTVKWTGKKEKLNKGFSLQYRVNVSVIVFPFSKAKGATMKWKGQEGSISTGIV